MLKALAKIKLHLQEALRARFVGYLSIWRTNASTHTSSDFWENFRHINTEIKLRQIQSWLQKGITMKTEISKLIFFCCPSWLITKKESRKRPARDRIGESGREDTMTWYSQTQSRKPTAELKIKKQPTNQSHNALWEDLSKNYWWGGSFYCSKEFAPFVGGK